jgi:hypothetical protein
MGDHYGRHEIEADRRKDAGKPEAPANEAFFRYPKSEKRVSLRERAARAQLTEFQNDLRGMSFKKMKTELDGVTRQIEELEPWQEALTFALEFPDLLREIVDGVTVSGEEQK